MTRPAMHPGRYQGLFLGVAVKTDFDFGICVRWKFQIVEGQFAGYIVSRTTYETDEPDRVDIRLLNMVSAMSITSLTHALIQKAVGTRGTVVVRWAGFHDVQVAEFIPDSDH